MVMKRAKPLLHKKGWALVAVLVLSAVSGAGAADRIAFVVPSATVYPGQVVSDTALLEKTNSGDTVFHAAAISGHLEQLPADLLTHDNLVIATKAGFKIGRAHV